MFALSIDLMQRFLSYLVPFPSYRALKMLGRARPLWLIVQVFSLQAGFSFVPFNGWASYQTIWLRIYVAKRVELIGGLLKRKNVPLNQICAVGEPVSEGFLQSQQILIPTIQSVVFNESRRNCQFWQFHLYIHDNEHPNRRLQPAGRLIE